MGNAQKVVQLAEVPAGRRDLLRSSHVPSDDGGAKEEDGSKHDGDDRNHVHRPVKATTSYEP